jgi:glycosyltransferase involved in cell wall biosynthesis
VEILFWVSLAGVLYPYVGYPLVLLLLGRLRRRSARPGVPGELPAVTMIIPANNEASRIAEKVANTAALDYPPDRLQVLFVCDGCTDDTADIIRRTATPAMSVLELPARAGKAAALNAGLTHARHEILVFSDASIGLAPDSLRQIVRRFQDPRVGCVSGEDRIDGSGGEALYGRYELALRRLESDVQSIVGASGSFYAQRRGLCAPFTPGMAPDFLSVLRTVEQGFRAVSEPRAVGWMTSAKDARHEFDRKVRTFIRGMTALFGHRQVLNPLRYGLFSFSLVSHKVMRWLAPVFLVGVLVSPIALLERPLYAAALACQAAFYLAALAAFVGWGPVRGTLFGRIALYFSSVNAAIVAAWFQYGRGVRQEVWAPTRR